MSVTKTSVLSCTQKPQLRKDNARGIHCKCPRRKSRTVLWGCQAQAFLQITGSCRGNAARKCRFPSSDVSGPRPGCTNRPCKTSSPLWRFGWARSAQVWPGSVWDQAVGKGLCESIWGRLHQGLTPSLGRHLCPSLPLP